MDRYYTDSVEEEIQTGELCDVTVAGWNNLTSVEARTRWESTARESPVGNESILFYIPYGISSKW